jgi:hypothetical protein
MALSGKRGLALMAAASQMQKTRPIRRVGYRVRRSEGKLDPVTKSAVQRCLHPSGRRLPSRPL